MEDQPPPHTHIHTLANIGLVVGHKACNSVNAYRVLVGGQSRFGCMLLCLLRRYLVHIHTQALELL